MSEAESVADPVSYFLEDMTYHGKSDRTRAAYERVLREFASFLRSQRAVESPADAGERDCLAYVHSLRGDAAASTVATYASYLHRFYAYMTQAGVFDANPMGLVMEELDESIESDPTRRDVTLPRMRSFLEDVAHPLDRAVLVTLLKTGLRVGELCNLDLRDLHLADVDLSGDRRGQLDGRPDTLYVAADVARGESVNGETRTASNKRQRATLVPVDDELRQVLLRWLTVRPDPRSAARPLFVSTRDRWGERLTPEMVRTLVERHARREGWYRTGGGASENVTPHYFRHFFTTHLRDRTGDRGVVKYLRGDVAEDIIDTYTHNWGDRVRRTYESSIYQLL